MRRLSTIGVILAALGTGLVSTPAAAQTLEQIQARRIEAQGGEGVLRGIRDMTIKGTIDLVQQGLKGTITIYKKEPDKRRSDTEVLSLVLSEAYDGLTAWATNPRTGAIEERYGSQLEMMKRQALPLTAVLEPEKFGISLSYTGKATIDGRECHVLEQSFDSGFVATIYVDAETYLTLMTKALVPSPDTGTSVAVEQVISDYKEVGGMMVGHSIVTRADGVLATSIRIENIRFNTGLQDSLFEMRK